ncbi:MAG: hypothetical protein AAFR53_08815 [Pseudomonadota bacterium]
MRVFAALSLVALSACAPAIPDSGAGVGFGSIEEFRAAQAARERALIQSTVPNTAPNTLPGAPVEAQPVIPGPVVSEEQVTAAPAPSPEPGPAPLPQSITDAVAAPAPVETAPLAIVTAEQPAPATAVPTQPRPAGISDEQNFDAVSSRETIESDAARLEQNRQSFEVAAVTPLPSRAGAGPNIVQYALNTSNVVGQSIYRRSGLTSQARHLRRCAQYPSADQAQQAFLAAGGPERDRQGLDPDGDGFACQWDPAPFRVVRN